MAERLTQEQATKLAKRVTAADNAVDRANDRVKHLMRERARVFLECFEGGLTIPEIAEAAGKSPAMVSIALSDARKAREEDAQTAATA